MANQLSELDLALSVADDLPLPWTAWRGTPLTTRDGADPQAHAGVDVLATLGSKAVQAQLNRKPNGLMADTALRTMCGAGNQHFLGFNGLDRSRSPAWALPRCTAARASRSTSTAISARPCRLPARE